jgi:CheY-like chemotaxis protein
LWGRYVSANVRGGPVRELGGKMGLLALIVDDSMLIRHTVCRFFEARGFAVESGANGLEALDKLAQRHPDIVVTDIQMPKMGGTELITVLKSQRRTADIPVVIVASKQSGFEKTENRADYVIFKDIDIEGQLEKAVASIFGEKAAAATRL